MSCDSFRKYIIPFADDELDAERDRVALEHLHACTECKMKVKQIESMKTAVGRVWSQENAPANLRSRISVALENEIREAGSDAVALSRPMRVSFWPVPLAMAAAILLAVGIWQPWQLGDQPGGSMTVVARVVTDVREQHNLCARHQLAHHDDSLTRQLPEIARRLSARLDMAVAAPDLSASGFELVGADACGIRGRQAAHLLYRKTSSREVLSLFTTKLVPELLAGTGKSTKLPDCYVREKDGWSIVAWNVARQSYVACADMPVDELVAIVQGFRSP